MEDWTADRLLQLSGGYWGSCALHACVKLDLFGALGKKVMGAELLAETLGADERALSMLLDAAAALGLLHKSAETYGNTPFSLRYLCKKTSPNYLGDILLHHHYLVEAWGKLDLSVLSGAPLRDGASDGDPVQREAFLMGMSNLASLVAPALVPQIDLQGKRQLLDLGGGPGTYAFHFCRQNPELEALVFDLPTSEPFESRCAQNFNLDDRVRFQGGDFLADEIEGRFDVAWLSHILHGESPENCALILSKAAQALEPGGLLLIHEFILDDSGAAPLFPALFSLNMLLNTQGGRSYRERELRAMLEAAGLCSIERLEIEIPLYSTVLAAKRKE